MVLLFAALFCLAASAKADPAPLQPTDVLTLQDGQFYLGGGKFAEISFDKFDVLWQIWDGLQAQAKGDGGVKLQKAIARQDSALRDLHSMGFRTIRMFGVPFQKLSSIWPDENLRKQLFQAVDTALDLCEKNGIQADFGLGLAGFADGDDATTVSPLFTDSHSPEREQCYAYIDATVNRCKNRKGIAMWEISNEMTNQSDIGVWKGKLQPSLDQTAGFFNDTAARIKQDDPLRLVSTGGSILRPEAWHREHHVKLAPDTQDQYRNAYADYFAHSAIDVVDTTTMRCARAARSWLPAPTGKRS